MTVSVTYGQTLTDIARSEALTWYGVDFSQAYFYHFADKLTADDLKDHLIDVWSSTERGDYIKQKYDFEKVDEDFSIVEKRNNAQDFSTRFVTQGVDLNMDMIRKIIFEYPITGNGYGLVFFVEGFENTTGYGYVWATYFNQSTKKIISARRYVIEAGIGNIQDKWMKVIERTVRQSSADLRGYKK